jgi:hypothetical protein
MAVAIPIPEIQVKRIGFLLTLVYASAALEACTGAIPEQTPNAPASAGGIWKGQMTAPSGATLPTLMMVTEDGKFFSLANNAGTGCADVAAGALTLIGDSYSGSANFGIITYAVGVGVQVDCAFSDGSVWGTAALTGSLVSRQTLTVTANDITTLGTALPGTTGMLNFDDVYNESSSLSKVSGNWYLSTNALLSIDSAGAIYSQDTVNGCLVNGKVTLINTKYNAYAVSVTYSNCGASASALDGLTATGLMTVDDTIIPTTLYVGYTLTLSNGEVLMVALTATK